MPPPRLTTLLSKPQPLLRQTIRQPTRQRIQQQQQQKRLSSSSPTTTSTPAKPPPLKNPNPFPDGILTGNADNAFNRERAAVKVHAEASADLWRKLSLYVVPPCIVWATINAWNLWNEHWEHWEHMPPLEERVQYSYQNVRTKNFFWGDGDKTLL